MLQFLFINVEDENLVAPLENCDSYQRPYYTCAKNDGVYLQHLGRHITMPLAPPLIRIAFDSSTPFVFSMDFCIRRKCTQRPLS